MTKARVQKRLYYKIGEACKTLGIQPYVLRYWETEFPILAPSKSRSGQRVYSEKELEVIRRIKELLYDEGYTIAGAKKKLDAELASGSLGEPREDDEDEPAATVEAAAPVEDTPPPPPAAIPQLAAEPQEEAAPRPRTSSPRKAAAARPPSAPLFEDEGAGQVPVSPPQTAALDTEGTERLQTLRSGIETALQEAREILALLDSKSP